MGNARRSRADEAIGYRGLVTGTPGLSVVLVTDHFRTIAHVVRRLSDQTAREQVEVVIVCPSVQALEADEQALRGFASIVTVETGTIHPMSNARAAGVRAATAPIVFVGETHSFPGPDFVSSLIVRHAEPWDVVVPGFDNANLDGPLSWAAFLLDYGNWLRHLPEGEVSFAPTWNVSYKREALLDLGAGLDTALTNGDELATAFRLRNRKIYFQPAARLDHANVSRNLKLWIDERYLSGLLVGSYRRNRWSMYRRVLYAFASPLIPVVLLRRTAGPVRVALRHKRLPPLTIPALVAGAVVRTVGEVVGYLAGARAHEVDRMEEYELHKVKYTATAR
jgi:hypothetical protein